jgi:uncharacterized membrane protein (UPF0127 family)
MSARDDPPPRSAPGRAQRGDRFSTVTNVTRGAFLATRAEHTRGALGQLVGLIGRTGLPPGGGLMLPRTRGVHSHCMRFPIDVVFYDRRRVVVGVVHALRPWRFSPYYWRAVGAIELPAGTARANGTERDDVLLIEDAERRTLAADEDSVGESDGALTGESVWRGLLTSKRAATYAAILGLLYLLAWGYSTFAGRAPLTRNGEPIPGDYIAFYTAGRMVLNGESSHLYDPSSVRAIQAEALEFLVPGLYDPMRNPPFLAVLFAPLATLDLIPSFVVWSLLNLACLVAALWLALRTLPALRPHWRAIGVVALTFAPVYRGLIGGQNADLSLLLYVLIYRAIRSGREPQAGLYAALGLFKPQLFLVFPLVFAASRRWRALGTYCLVASMLAAASFALVGVDGVWAWSRVILEHEPGNALKNAYRMHSLKAFFDLLLPFQSTLALVLSVLASAALLVPLVRAWSVQNAWQEQLPMRWALTSAIAVLVDPHLVDYDLAVLVLTGLLIGAVSPAGRRWALGFYAAMVVALLFDFKLPIGDTQLQLTVPILVAFAWWAWRHLNLSRRGATSDYATVPALAVGAK